MAGIDRPGLGAASGMGPQDSALAIAQAVDHLKAGRRAEAAALCQGVLEREPDYPDALHMLGGMALQEGDAERAVALIGRAAALDPGQAARFLDLAVAQANLGRLEAAAESFERVLGLQPRHVLALQSLGQIHHQRGAFAAAVDCYQRALAVEPARASLHKGLGDSLRRLGQTDQAADAFRQALAIEPNDRPALIELGSAERDRGRLAEALDCFRRAVELEPGDGATFNLIGIVHSERGESDAAAAAYRHAISLRPDLVGARANLARLHITAGEAAAALEAAEGALQVDPTLGSALADKGIALHELGRTAEAEALLDYDRFVQSRKLAPPPGYADLAAFNAALADALQAHPSLSEETPKLATRGGRQTREIFDGSEPVESLRRMITAALDDYIAGLPPDPGHPFTAMPRQAYETTGWGVILNSLGYQEPHIHAGSWISGVYYVALPPGTGESADETSGWLEFGRCNGIFELQRPPRIHAVRPEVGLLVLFPSFFWHGTVPFESSAPRISIAFDAVRVS